MFLGIFYFLKKGNILEDICEDAFNKRCYYNSNQATQGCWCLQLVHSNKPIQENSCAEEVVLVFYFLSTVFEETQCKRASGLWWQSATHRSKNMSQIVPTSQISGER